MPTRPVRIVTEGGMPVRIVTHGPADLVREVTHGPSDPVRVVTSGISDPVIGITVTPPTPPIVVPPVLSAPAFAQQNTAVTNNMNADGYSWPQAWPIQIDKYGHLFALSQAVGGDHYFTYSNDAGTTWADATVTQGFLQRGTCAYDSVNDIIHVLWNATAATDGIIYRRYTFTRNGANEITDIARDMSVNPQLDLETTGTMTYTHPIVIWCNDAAYGVYGAIVCIWGARNAGVGGGNEIRASMRILTNDANDSNVANWVAPVAADVTTIGNAPAVAYSALLANATASYLAQAATRKLAGTNAKDIYVAYHNGAVPGAYLYLRMRWNAGANDWSTGLSAATAIMNMQRAGADTGYAEKSLLLSKLCEDLTNDRMYLALANWKSNADGDTWSFIYIDSAGAVSAITDIYSAGGAHSYAPTGDITYDNTVNALAVSYIKTATQAAYVQQYQGVTQIQTETLLFDTEPVDIPLLFYNPQTGAGRIGTKLASLFRDTNAPKLGWFGTMEWS